VYKRKVLVTSTIFLAFLMLFSSLMPVTAVVYPYSVSTGDKLPYNVTALKNGSYTGWLMVWGVNLSVGDNFFMEIFDRPAHTGKIQEQIVLSMWVAQYIRIPMKEIVPLGHGRQMLIILLQ
jgi:hypothetical protein